MLTPDQKAILKTIQPEPVRKAKPVLGFLQVIGLIAIVTVVGYTLGFGGRGCGVSRMGDAMIDVAEGCR